MARFKEIKTLQKFTAVHASIRNHHNLQYLITSRDVLLKHRAAALTEWRQPAA